MKLYCKRCNCVFDSNDVPEYVSGYGEAIDICPECRTPLELFDENFFYEDTEDWGDDF